MANRAVTFDGPERRSGFERRSVAPREMKAGPRLLQTIDVGGVLFRPGSEAKFHEAVSAYNEKAKAENRNLVDLAFLESKGFIAGFGGKAQEFVRSRNEQRTTPSDPEPAKLANPGYGMAPGGAPLEELHPRAPNAGEPGYSTAYGRGQPTTASATVAEAAGAGGGARTGGAGKTGSKGGGKHR
jgi:hypothetical protein